MNNLDDIASAITRRAAIGLLPPPVLKGRLSGVYFRPRFLAAMRWPLVTQPNCAGSAAWRVRAGFTRSAWWTNIYTNSMRRALPKPV